MAKIIKDTELADIIRQAVVDPGLVDCADSYEHFLEDLGDLVAKHFGGVRSLVTAPDDIMDNWTVGFQLDENVPADGGIFAGYDTDVVWKDGKEL